MPQFETIQDRTIVITGGAGFIGSHLAEKCLELGARVIVIDNLSSGSWKNLAHLDSQELVKIEADANIVPPELIHEKPFAVLHFASLAGPPLYRRFPEATYKINSFGTDAWLQWIKQKSPNTRFLFASTSEVYGDPQVSPQPESYWGNVNPNGARACYDESKRFGEMVCGVFHRLHKLDTRIVRIFNTYGPRMNTIDGRVLPAFILAGLKNQPLLIHGTGEQTRSFCYVSDLVSGILKLLTVEHGAGLTINLGNPDERTISQVAGMIQKLLQVSEIQHVEKAEDDPSNRKPEISKANTLLDWTPKIPFDEGLNATITYFRDHLVNQA